MERRGSTAVWGVMLALAVASGVFGWMHLSQLPQLDMMLGPDLTVRHVAVERDAGADGQTFQRGDRLTHVEGISVDHLEELRGLLPPLIKDADPPEYEEDEGRPEDEEQRVQEAEVETVVIDYQLFRPVHRFLLAMQEETIEPGELPPGVEPGDRLVEVDGRPLPDKMGTEGIRNVAASRPDAVIGIERADAIFSGQVQIDPESSYPGVVVTFALVLLVLGIIWRFHSDRVGLRAAYCVGLETLCLGWMFLLVFGFQWVMGDPWLATGVIAGLVMIRPLSMFAREQAGVDSGGGGTIALAIGALAALVLTGLMFGGQLASAEEAMHAAALVTGLFVIYELAVGGMEGRTLLDLGDRGGYLGGIVVLGLLVCIVMLAVEPVAFREDTWRWFAVSLPALMWFGDVLYVVKYGAHSAMGEVAQQRARQRLIREYLQEMAEEMPNTDLKLIGMVDERAVQIRAGSEGLDVAMAETSLADAVEIMSTENAPVPLPESADRRAHPMAGIAQAMDMALGVELADPPGMLQLNGESPIIAVVGIRESEEGDVPSYASSETLDRAQELWNGPVATAALIEVMSALPVAAGKSTGTDGTVEKAPASMRRKLEEAQQQAAEFEEENQQLVEQRQQVEQQLEAQRRQVQICQLTRGPDHPEVTEQWRGELLESELIRALEYLLDDPEPVVLAGPSAAGKEFTALQTHILDGGSEENFLIVDATRPGWQQRIDAMLGEEGGGDGEGLLADFEGALSVRGAQRCDDQRLLALCHQCEEKRVRLFLSFEADDAEERSVLEDCPETLRELLTHRELIIPRFGRRDEIVRPVCEFWLEQWANLYDRRVDGFSRMAMEALEAYHYPGEIGEAVEVVRLAVLAADHDVVDRENLPVRVRDARPL